MPKSTNYSCDCLQPMTAALPNGAVRCVKKVRKLLQKQQNVAVAAALRLRKTLRYGMNAGNRH